MSDRKRKILVIIAAFVIIIVLPAVIFTVMKLTMDTNVISYKGTVYSNTKIQVDLSNNTQEFTKQFNTALDSNTAIYGMRVYESTAAKIRGYAPYLYLVDSDGIIWVYGLASGN